MGRSKIDKLEWCVARAVREAIQSCQLEAAISGKSDSLVVLRMYEDTIVARAEMRFSGETYRRLEVADIIAGNKRAWPDPEAK